MSSTTTARQSLQQSYPWTAAPLIVSAPMRVMSGPQLAVAVSAAGGLGFIGPGLSAAATLEDLQTARTLVAQSETLKTVAAEQRVLPLGVGFQIWNGDVETACRAIAEVPVSAVWLFAPRDEAELKLWVKKIRAVVDKDNLGTKVWLQVGTVGEAVAAASLEEDERVDVVVIQGDEAGGHRRTANCAGFVTLLPEVADLLKRDGKGSEIPLFAAGGIADGRGVAAALAVGAAGAVLGTRFLATPQARIKEGYRDEVVRAENGGENTVRTQLWNHLRGTFGWPGDYMPRGVVNASYREEKEGVPFEELKRRHDEAVEKSGNEAWGMERGRTATYAGAGVGLVRGVEDAGELVGRLRAECKTILTELKEKL